MVVVVVMVALIHVLILVLNEGRKASVRWQPRHQYVQVRIKGLACLLRIRCTRAGPEPWVVGAAGSMHGMRIWPSSRI